MVLPYVCLMNTNASFIDEMAGVTSGSPINIHTSLYLCSQQPKVSQHAMHDGLGTWTGFVVPLLFFNRWGGRAIG